MHPNRAIYDSAGRLRFSQADQEGPAGDRTITYRKYDELGRPIEGGTYPYDWNDGTDAALRARADQPQWPPATTAVQTVTRHDGDGSDPSAIGHITRVVQTNPRQTGTQKLATTVTETFQYGSGDQITNKTLSVSGVPGGDRVLTVSYAHDCLGNVTQITYPQGDVTGVARVCYSYNRLGRVVGIGTSPADPIAYASYTYDAAGKRIATGLNSDRLRSLASFTSPGWLSNTQISAATGFATRSVHQY